MFPLTHPQKRIWFMEKMNPGQSLHVIGGTVRIKGPVDFKLLEEAIQGFVKAHAGIRHQFEEKDGDVAQYVKSYERFHIPFFDFSKQRCPEEDFAAWVQSEAETPFQLHHSALFDFAFFTLGDDDNGYLVKVHHLVADGWSMDILTKQIGESYVRLSKGEKSPLPGGSEYTYYLHNESKYLSSRRFIKNREFWLEKFNDIPEPLRKGSLECGQAMRKTYRLSEEQSRFIREFAARSHYSVYAFFVALYLLYHYKLTNRDDLVVGMPLYNRSGKREKQIVGMFTSTMPFRFRLDAKMSVLQLIESVHQELVRCYYHQKYPFNLLTQDVESSQGEFTRLLSTCINYYNTDLVHELNGIPVENREFHNGKQIYSLQLVIREWSGSEDFQLDLDYKIQNYTTAQIDQMYRCFVHIIDEMLHSPARRLDEISLLSEDERNKLIVQFNDTRVKYPRDQTIHQLFEEQVIKTPEKVALFLGNKEMTYDELNGRSNQLARFLLKRNVRKGTIVGLLCSHSFEAVIGMLGVLKAGATYLPIDPNYPLERVRYILQDAQMKWVLIDDEATLPGFTGEVIPLHADGRFTGPASNVDASSGPSDLAYIIYTSGSTGYPKGTMIEHGGLVNYVSWAKKTYIGSSETEVFPFYSSLAFDLTVTSIFTPLISGNTVIIYPEEEDAFVLHKILRDGRASIIKLTPSHLSLLLEWEPRASSIKKWIVGGEDLKVNLAKKISDRFPGTQIYNEYGPTEATVGCMIHRFDRQQDTGISVPIGVPADNTRIYVLDAYQNPVPIGEVGELYISGDGVARGYLHQPRLTQEKFVNNPFHDSLRMYRSGDLARFIDEKRIEYIGRADHQEKIRGYRIERGEIEHCLLTHPLINEAVVVNQKSISERGILYAYYTGKKTVSESDLKEHLAEFLPDYMIPAAFMKLDHMPLTVNGKIDYERLPLPPILPINPVPDAISDEKEAVLLQVIQQVLQVKAVESLNNFYHLGGDSIQAIQAASRLANHGYKIRVKDMLAHPVLKDMSLYMEELKNTRAIQDRPCEGRIGTLPIMGWFFSRNLTNPHYYTQSVLLDLKEEIQITKLEKAWTQLVQYHDAFRINIDKEDSVLYYNPHLLGQEVPLHRVDLSLASASEQRIRMSEIAEQIKSNFSIDEGLLVQACLFHLGDQGQKLLMTAHHIAVDGISWRIVLEDLYALYEKLRHDEPVSLPPKTHSLQDWALALNQFARRITDEEKRYWEAVSLSTSPSWIDYDLGPDRLRFSDTRVESLTREQTEQLLGKANQAYSTKADELLLIALAIHMKNVMHSHDVIIEVEGHGREEVAERMDVSRTVGWFTSIYPVRLRVDGADLSSQIKELKDQLRSIPHHGISYGVLKYLSGELSHRPQKSVRFNYLGDFDSSFSNEMFELAGESVGRESSEENEMDCLLDMVIYSVNKKMTLSVTYSLNKFKPETIKQFTKAYLDQLDIVLHHCCRKEDTDFTHTDFETANLSNDELEGLFNN
ncbi:non-ribosomal peptide synthetase [Fischerella thermalis CCMEE 5273]|nr:non-ribosomal peptide synthetase [Fischerella thermalis CCMEE 5273]